MRTVFAPKIIGVKVVNLAAELMPLQVNMVFSSIAALFGSAGQANYSAANAVLNSYALKQHSSGRVGGSIMWGVWAIGMAARTQGLSQKSRRNGLGVIQPDNGLNVFTLLLSNVRLYQPEIVVSSFKWNRLLGQRTLPPPSFFNDVFSLTPEVAVPHSSNSTTLLVRNDALPGREAFIGIVSGVINEKLDHVTEGEE
jgi:KR domain